MEPPYLSHMETIHHLPHGVIGITESNNQYKAFYVPDMLNVLNCWLLLGGGAGQPTSRVPFPQPAGPLPVHKFVHRVSS